MGESGSGNEQKWEVVKWDKAGVGENGREWEWE